MVLQLFFFCLFFVSEERIAQAQHCVTGVPKEPLLCDVKLWTLQKSPLTFLHM